MSESQADPLSLAPFNPFGPVAAAADECAIPTPLARGRSRQAAVKFHNGTDFKCSARWLLCLRRPDRSKEPNGGIKFVLCLPFLLMIASDIFLMGAAYQRKALFPGKRIIPQHGRNE